MTNDAERDGRVDIYAKDEYRKENIMKGTGPLARRNNELSHWKASYQCNDSERGLPVSITLNAKRSPARSFQSNLISFFFS